MNKITILILLYFYCFFSLDVSQATTIIPYPNLGEMAKSSPVVVLATATRNYEVTTGNTVRYRTEFEVVSSIKGEISNEFSIQSLKLKEGELNRIVFGDMVYEQGSTYLLFLSPKEDYWSTVMMSHAVFQKWERSGQTLLSPVEEGLNHFTLRRPDGQSVEPFYVYDLNRLVGHLKRVVTGTTNWDSATAKTDYPIAWFQATTRAAPSHCTFLGDPAPFARWTDFPTVALPVHYSSLGDASCPTANTKVQGVISSLNANYTGLNLSDAGTHSFVPSCAGGEGANDNEFTSFVNGTLGGTRHLVVQYNDPCNEITDLVGCNGVLAFGGFYWFSSTHTWDGMPWNAGAYGYVVVNNGTGACQCPSTDYDIMMTHEITHALGIGHIAPGVGGANMNPSCCEAISALDVECLDYTYAPLALPVELYEFDGKLVEKKSHLNWSTVSEQNNDFFTIERSNDGRSFEILDKIVGKGTTTEFQNYTFIDPNPALGINYYRLSQTDFDGRSERIGDLVVIENNNDGNISIRPNPVQDAQVNISLVTENRSSIAIQLYNMNGQLMKNQQSDLIKGKNEISLNVDDLTSGVYLMKAVIDGVVQTHRLIVTR